MSARKKYRSTVIRAINILEYIADNQNVNGGKIEIYCNVAYPIIRKVLDVFVKNELVVTDCGSTNRVCYNITIKGKMMIDNFSNMKPILLELESGRC